MVLTLAMNGCSPKSDGRSCSIFLSLAMARLPRQPACLNAPQALLSDGHSFDTDTCTDFGLCRRVGRSCFRSGKSNGNPSVRAFCQAVVIAFGKSILASEPVVAISGNGVFSGVSEVAHMAQLRLI